jgi:hypothetical protein
MVLYMKTNVHFYHISLSSSWNEKCLKYVYVHCLFSEIRAVNDIRWNNILQPERPQIAHVLCMLDT